MGTKYTTISSSGYNSSPPPDNGTQVAANLITWSGIKTKLGDPLKTFAESINTSLLTVFDQSARQVASPDSAVAGDHNRLLEVTGTTTITLSDAATMGAGYTMGVMNAGSGVVTVTPGTASNTINNVSASVTVPILGTIIFRVNASNNGYNIISQSNRQDAGTINNTVIGGTTPAAGSFTSVVTPIVDSGSGSLVLKGAGTTAVTITGAGTSFSGTISSSVVSGASISLLGATTGANWIHLSNTSADSYIGIEGAAGSAILSGTSAYSLVIGSFANKSVHLVSNNIIAQTITGANTVLAGTLTTDTILSAATTATVFNTVATTVNAFGAASVALNIGNASAAAAFAGGISIPTGKSVTGAGTATVTGFTTISAATGMAVGGATAGTGGIAFPATAVAVADVNTLDDYEEGTWTPSVGGTATYISQTGVYTKIGNTVTVMCKLKINAIGSGSTTTISGLPFTSNAGQSATGAVYYSGLAVNSIYEMAVVDPSATTVQLFGIAAAGTGLTSLAVFGNGAEVRFSLTYFI